MENVLDENAKTDRLGNVKRVIQVSINIYAAILTLIFLFAFAFIEVKNQPTPLEAASMEEVSESYSYFTGICVNVGDCGNDQVVLGLEKNAVSMGFFNFLVWKDGISR